MAFSLKMGVEYDGDQVVLARFQALDKKLRKKYLKDAMRDAGKSLKNATRSGTPTRLGILRKSLKNKVKAWPSGNVTAIVGASKGFRQEIGTYTRGKRAGTPKYADPTKYLHLVELGTSRSRAVGMMQDAYSAKKSEIKQTVLSAMQEAVSDAAGGS